MHISYVILFARFVRENAPAEHAAVEFVNGEPTIAFMAPKGMVNQDFSYICSRGARQVKRNSSGNTVE